MIVSFVFGLLAFIAIGNGVQSRRAQALVLGRVPPEEWEGVCAALRGSAWRGLLVGTCFAAAAVLVWWSWPIAAVVGGWPIVLFALLAA